MFNDEISNEPLSMSSVVEDRSLVQIRLMKGPVYRLKQKEIWEALERHHINIKKFFLELGLDLMIDDVEGFAYLKQKDLEDENVEIPNLISRRQLTLEQSLLLLVIRKKLSDHDSEGGDLRLVLKAEDIHESIMPFFGEVNNEVHQRKKFDSLITKAVELGFLTKIKTSNDEFEVQRIIKAFIDANFLEEKLTKLKELKIKKDSVEEV